MRIIQMSMILHYEHLKGGMLGTLTGSPPSLEISYNGHDPWVTS
jgi:hypothetical protein